MQENEKKELELLREKKAATERALMALANDAILLQEASDRVVAQIRAIAIEHKVEMVELV